MEKLKVLYAEDDPLTVMEVAEQLEERGFEVIVATNGTEALKLFRERQPNVVLLDVDMPVSLWKNYGIEQTSEHPEYDYCYCEGFISIHRV